MYRRMMALRLDAGSNTNGNSRRGWLVIDTETGESERFFHDSETGKNLRVIRDEYPNLVVSDETIATTPSEVKRFTKLPKRA